MTRGRTAIEVTLYLLAVLFGVLALASDPRSRVAPRANVTVETLLEDMWDLDELAKEPSPFYKQSAATSSDPDSRPGQASWFSNKDFDNYVRTESTDGRLEDVMADLRGPGALTRIWTANPTLSDELRFYFDGERKPRLQCSFADLFTGKVGGIGPDFAYEVAGAGDFYFPLPYARSLKITREHVERVFDPEDPVSTTIYYQIGYRTYDPLTRVETYAPENVYRWQAVQRRGARALSHPSSGAPWSASRIRKRWTIPPGETRELPVIDGEKTVYEWSARILGTRESEHFEDPLRPENAYRFMLLEMDFDGDPCVRTPLGDFFGAGPGINPFENLAFSVEANGEMTSRWRMPFKRRMRLALTNAGPVAYTVEVEVTTGSHAFTSRDWHFHAQWGAVTRDSVPEFDMTFLAKTGPGKLVGSLYEIANPVLKWWGEGDQKIFVDREPFPSTFGTGTEDDYGFAYARGDIYSRPYHGQMRLDGPRNGGLASMLRLNVLDAVPYRKEIRFDVEALHWINCQPTWSHVVYWYGAPGTPGPDAVDRSRLAPRNLGRPADMSSVEGEELTYEATGGVAEEERLVYCSQGGHVVWRDAALGDRLTVHFDISDDDRYAIWLALEQLPSGGRYRFSIDGEPAELEFDGFARDRRWGLPMIGIFRLAKGSHSLVAEILEPDRDAQPGNRLGLDYVLFERQRNGVRTRAAP